MAAAFNQTQFNNSIRELYSLPSSHDGITKVGMDPKALGHVVKFIAAWYKVASKTEPQFGPAAAMLDAMASEIGTADFSDDRLRDVYEAMITGSANEPSGLSGVLEEMGDRVNNRNAWPQKETDAMIAYAYNNTSEQDAAKFAADQVYASIPGMTGRAIKSGSGGGAMAALLLLGVGGGAAAYFLTRK